MNEYIDLMGQMMACRPISANIPAVNNAMKLMREFLEARNVHCTLENDNGRDILYASTIPGKEAEYLFNAHLDVVAVQDESMHTLVIKDDIAYGRGTDDDMGGATAIARLLVELKGRASVGAIFTADEEIGGSTTAYMVKQGYKGTKLAFVLDGTAYSICTAQKGIISAILKAHGKGGHASRPWNFDNPIEKLIEAYSRLRAAWTYPDDPTHWYDTMTPCIIKGGAVHNQIPDEAEMTLNIRYTNADDKEKIIDKIKSLTNLDLEFHETCTPLYSDENQPMMQKLMAAMRKSFPDKNVQFTKMMGATDARHLCSMNIPIVITGVAGQGAHSATECLYLKSWQEVTDCLKQFILDN